MLGWFFKEINVLNYRYKNHFRLWELSSIPWIQFDWNPALNPFDIR